MSFLVVGLNHRTASVEIRERVSVPGHTLPSVLKRFHQRASISECAILSTCNRTEVYLASDLPELALEDAVAALCQLSGLEKETLRKHLFVCRDREAAVHLFGVTSGLDSMIMGEPQIAGQVKEAGAAAMEAGTSRVLLNRLFSSALGASKRARTETEIGVGAVSVSFAAVELARKIFGDLRGRVALVFGAGEMGQLTAKHLVQNGVGALIVASRTLERVQDLAGRMGGRAMDWQDAVRNLHRADIVISSTGASHYVLHRKVVAEAMKRRKNQQMFLIDIAVPRDVDPEVGELYNVFLYDVDDLQSVVGVNLKKRQEEAEKAKRILDEEVTSFIAWKNSLQIVPIITALRRYFQDVVEEELGRAKLSGFSDAQMVKVAELFRRYVNKILHAPQTRLKEVTERGNPLAYVESLVHLFDLQTDGEAGVGTAAENESKLEKERNL